MIEDDDIQPEPVRGLPERPPEGERILWQGSPDWRALAWRAFAVKWVLVYFGAIAVWRAADMGLSGAGLRETVISVAMLMPVALGAVAVLALMAWVTAKTTVYTITNRRVAMRIGVALTVTLNLPFRWIGAASFAGHSDGTGDIPLSLTGETRLAYLMMWPHVRPWKTSCAEPMLRAVPEGERVAAILADALLEAHPEAAGASRPERATALSHGLVAAE